MQHSVKNISNDLENISKLRNDSTQFKADNFFNFAKENINIYHLIENGNDLLVSTWYSNDLINDYRNTLK